MTIKASAAAAVLVAVCSQQPKMLPAPTFDTQAAKRASLHEKVDSLPNLLNMLSIGLGATWGLRAMRSTPHTSGVQAAQDFQVALPTAKGPTGAAIASRALELTKELEAPGRKYVYFEGTSPITVVETPNESIVLLGPLALDTVFNTLRTTARERAATVVTSEALPALKSLVAAIGTTDVFPRLAVTVVYGSKNLAGQSDVLNLKAEAVTIIAPRLLLLGFSKGELTEDEVVEKSDIFLMDRDDTGLKKIRLLLK